MIMSAWTSALVITRPLLITLHFTPLSVGVHANVRT
jgi:hypothetical protein